MSHEWDATIVNPKQTKTCRVCGKTKESSTWVTVRIEPDSGEYSEFVSLYGEPPINVCFCYYVRPILKLEKGEG